MAVQEVTVKKNYICESGDTKPTDSTVPIGSEAFETDTKATYIWDGSNWISKT